MVVSLVGSVQIGSGCKIETLTTGAVSRWRNANLRELGEANIPPPLPLVILVKKLGETYHFIQPMLR